MNTSFGIVLFRCIISYLRECIVDFSFHITQICYSSSIWWFCNTRTSCTKDAPVYLLQLKAGLKDFQIPCQYEMMFALNSRLARQEYHWCYFETSGQNQAAWIWVYWIRKWRLASCGVCVCLQIQQKQLTKVHKKFRISAWHLTTSREPP